MALLRLYKQTTSPTNGAGEANKVAFVKQANGVNLIQVADNSGNYVRFADNRRYMAVTIDSPTNGDHVPIGRLNAGGTILAVWAVVVGGSGDSVQVQVESATAENAASPTAHTSLTTVSWATTNSGSAITVSTGTVASAAWVWVDIGTIGGTPTSVTVVVRYAD